jgi:hypothetical protein
MDKSPRYAMASLIRKRPPTEAALLLQGPRQNRCERYGVQCSPRFICDHEGIRNPWFGELVGVPRAFGVVHSADT